MEFAASYFREKGYEDFIIVESVSKGSSLRNQQITGQVKHADAGNAVIGELDLATFWQQWLNWQAPVNQRAWAFHDALAQGFAALMREQATMRGITTLVFSGGVIHNRLLRARLAHYLADFTLLFPQSLPAGDGGLSLGQGVIAAARWLAGEVQNG